MGNWLSLIGLAEVRSDLVEEIVVGRLDSAFGGLGREHDRYGEGFDGLCEVGGVGDERLGQSVHSFVFSSYPTASPSPNLFLCNLQRSPHIQIVLCHYDLHQRLQRVVNVGICVVRDGDREDCYCLILESQYPSSR